MSLLAVAVSERGLVDPAEPVFGAADEALLRGEAAFETLRVYGGRPFLLDRHLERFHHSIAMLGLASASGVEGLVGLAVSAAPPEHVLRLYRTTETIVASAAALPSGLDELRRRGLALRTIDVGTPSRLLVGVKSTSYASSFAARREAQQARADDALLVSAGEVLDAATANIWWCDDDTIYTPAAGPGVLAGVTRSLVLELEPVVEGTFELPALAQANEAFTTSSIREVMPVVTLDGRPIGDGRPGPAAARLQEALRLRSTAGA
jgi:branched-subunit amino acid aminotransferase/4-amino-4-deoxychorismate lyase